jgi:membrane protein YdbS with pleckstrin-like domain
MDLRPHARVLTRPVLVLVVGAGLGGFAVGRVPDGDLQAPGRVVAAALVALLLGRWAALPFLRWRATRFLVTDTRVLTRRGVVSRSGRDLPLSRIGDLSFSRGPLDRLFGSGTVVLTPVGDSPPLVLRRLPRVAQVQRELYELLEPPD